LVAPNTDDRKTKINPRSRYSTHCKLESSNLNRTMGFSENLDFKSGGLFHGNGNMMASGYSTVPLAVSVLHYSNIVIMSKCRSQLRIEQLESRFLCAADWQNPVNRLDANHSGIVEPIDALVVINDINANGSRVLGARPFEFDGPYVDVNGDGSCGPLDALFVINALNRVEVGMIAPEVRLPNQDGEMVDLSSLIGESAVVLYFYPKDDTPGCTVEALDFSARKGQIEALGAKLYGVSVDNVKSHSDFSSTHQLSFDILADADKQITTRFGALTEINNTPIAKRTTFIIGADGVVKQVFTDVDVLIHGEEVVAALQAGVAR
jgi:peroxiredoxin Q/BCP